MDMFDRNKLLKAGFGIFRTRRTFPIQGSGPARCEIWKLSERESWCLYEKCPSQAAMNRARADLKKSPRNIFD
ncbi:hypothetical protein ES708_01007 [subsurface metagenome]